MVTSALAGEPDKEKSNEIVSQSYCNCDFLLPNDDLSKTCYGTFYLTDPTTHKILGTVHYSVATSGESNCFTSVSKWTLSLADANPQYDVIGSGSYY